MVYNNLPEVIRILARSPESLSEIDIRGQGPLYLAATKARILHHLLKVAIPNQLHQRDKFNVSVLETAMVLSSSLCNNGWSTEVCHGCGCVACVDLLLEAGCEVRMNPVERYTQPALSEILEQASELARRRYISHMKGCQTRQTFSSFGNTRPRDHWKIPGANFCSISASTATVEERLTIVRDSDNPEQLAWVYEEIYDNHTSGLFYSCGIRPARSFPRLRNRNRACLPAYFFWLLQHGVDLRLEMPTEPPHSIGNQNIGILGAHYAFYLLGEEKVVNRAEEWVYPFDSTGEWTEVAKSVIRDNLTDGCECHCSTGGCDPFLCFLKGMALPLRELRNYYDNDQLEVWIKPMDGFYSGCGIELTALTFKAAIRYVTFHALKLSHTCCDTGHLTYGYATRGGNTWLDKDEVKTINEEQAHLLKLHEELVAEFQEKAFEYIKKESDGSPRFPVFWDEYWIGRMKEELQKLKGANLTDEERRGAEDIGVHWCEPPVDKSRATNPYDRDTVEHWFFKLDSVCPELNEPWPEGLHRVDELP